MSRELLTLRIEGDAAYAKVALYKEQERFGLSNWVREQLEDNELPVRFRLAKLMESLAVNTPTHTGRTQYSNVRMRQLAWHQVHYVKNDKGEVYFCDPHLDRVFEMYIVEVDINRPWAIHMGAGKEVIYYMEDTRLYGAEERMYNWYN